jgi:hypothetical protein
VATLGDCRAACAGYPHCAWYELGQRSVAVYEDLGNGYCKNSDTVRPPVCRLANSGSSNAACEAECDFYAENCIGYSFRASDGRCIVHLNPANVWQPKPNGGLRFRGASCFDNLKNNAVEITQADGDQAWVCKRKGNQVTEACHLLSDCPGKLQQSSSTLCRYVPDWEQPEKKYCMLGVQSGSVCCGGDCDGACGGAGCNTRPGGSARCCWGTVNDAGRTCSGPEDVACVVPPTPPPTPSPTSGAGYPATPWFRLGEIEIFGPEARDYHCVHGDVCTVALTSDTLDPQASSFPRMWIVDKVLV